jgi:hypothetical protein
MFPEESPLGMDFMTDDSPGKSSDGNWEEWMHWDKTTAEETSPSSFASGALRNLDKISLSIEQEPDFFEQMVSPTFIPEMPTPVGTSSSPESSSQRNSKKRKSSTENDEGQTREGKPVKKTAHNVIEKKYRNNLNDKIVALRDSVPSLRIKAQPIQGTGKKVQQADLDGLTPAHKLNKGTVLSKATEYIQHLESRIRRAEVENTALKDRIDVLENAARSQNTATDVQIAPPGRVGQRSPYVEAASSSTAIDENAQGMIPVPDSMRRLRAGLLQQHVERPPESRGNSITSPTGSREINRRGGGFGSKVMVGSLAGLMLVEGLGSIQSSKADILQKRSIIRRSAEGYLDEAGLWNAILHTSAIISPYLQSSGFMGLKGFVFVLALIYLAKPLFKSRKRWSRGDPTTTVAKLTKAPSPASPLEVRRSAWLTSIQIVQVPRHSCVSKVCVIGRMTVELNLRNILGWQWYTYLAKINEEQELARVKAWDIAVDALLAGGDAEINKIRLILAIMASGTLPETRTRFMMKALHIRILLWEAINAGNGSYAIFEDAVAGLGRWQWRKGQDLQHQIATQSSKTVANSSSTSDHLPDYLVALLERDADEVLVGPIVHRAYNLAWNKSTTDDITDSDDGLNSVVEDFAIRSPLDAIAAWWSSLVLRDSLLTALEKGGKWDGLSQAIDLSLQTSPPASVAQLRALAVKSVFSSQTRKRCLQQAFEILPRPSSRRASSSTPTSLLATPDVLVALRCALALDQRAESTEKALEALASVDTLLSHLPTADLHLLGFMAAYTTLRLFNFNDVLNHEGSSVIFSLAAYLKHWIRGDPGRKSGLTKKTREDISESCASIKGNVEDLDSSVSEELDESGHATPLEGSD